MCESGDEAKSIKHFMHFFKFKHPTTVAVTGPSQVGKSFFCIKLLNELNDLMTPCPTQIIWAYGVRDDEQMDTILQVSPTVEFTEELPEKRSFCNPNQKTLLILDDLMDEVGRDKEIAKLFTMNSHHCNTSVITIQHNLFNQEKFSRTQNLNTHYNTLFQSKRDKSQITRLNTSMFPQYPKFLQSAYDQAVEGKDFKYLIVDSHPRTPESLSVVTGIFKDEIPQVFIPSDCFK